ncbi:hypothetical protein D3C74_166370 [compost metagenome]
MSQTVKRIQKRLSHSDDGAAFKESIKEVVTVGVDQFLRHLQLERTQVNTVSDFEKMVKLGLLMYGEPTERSEVTTDIKIHETQLESIVKMPEFEVIKNRLAEQMNRENEGNTDMRGERM